MNSPMTKDLVIDKNSRLIYITAEEMGDLALVIDASDNTLLDWGPDDKTSRKYAQTKKRACKARQDIGNGYPELLTIHLLATTTTPHERCYAVKRARMGDTEFVKTPKRLYGEPEFHNWLQGEMANAPLDLRIKT